MNPIHTETYRGCKIRLESDEHMECPLDDSDGTVMRVAHWHRRYNIGSKRGERIDSDYLQPKDWLKEHSGPGFIVLPLRMLDHSGLDFSVGTNAYDCDPGGWDSCQVGFVWCTWKEARKALAGSNATLRKVAIDAMTRELGTYNDWQAGSGAGYIAETEDGTEIESCWGFLPEGNDYAYAIQSAKDAIDSYLADPNQHNQPGEH